MHSNIHHEPRLSQLDRAAKRRELHSAVSRADERRRAKLAEYTKLPVDPDRLYRDEPALLDWIVIVLCYVGLIGLVRWLMGSHETAAVIIGLIAIAALGWRWVRERYEYLLANARAGIR